MRCSFEVDDLIDVSSTRNPQVEINQYVIDLDVTSYIRYEFFYVQCIVDCGRFEK